jgi:hypothetical protein
MTETVGEAMHQTFYIVHVGLAPPPIPPDQIAVVADRGGRPMAIVGHERRWPAVLVHPDTPLAAVLADEWLMDLVMEGLPAILVGVNEGVAGVLPAGAIRDRVAASYDGPAAASSNTLGQTLDFEVTGDPRPAPAAQIRCGICAALNRVDRDTPAEPQCRNGHPLDPDFG